MLENKDFDINRLLHEIREVIEKQVYERGISLSEKEYNLKYRYLNGSPVHLKRILMNIISNAVKYNKEKGEILLSYYGTQVDNRHILFEFQCKDTGVGMSKEFQNHIFEPFTQETGGARSVYGGTGLGMPITKKLIEKMGGTIKFESEKNVGTTFMVQLPFLISADMKQAESQNKCLQNVLAYGIIKTWRKICLISIIMNFHMVEDMCIPCSIIWYGVQNTGKRF